MRAYADSSFILRLLLSEAGATHAAAEYRRIGRPNLFYLGLHALEVENGIRHRAFHARRMLPSGERMSIKREFDTGFSRLGHFLKIGMLREVSLDMESAMERARLLSSNHTERLGARAIDLLHVACALLLESEVFLTFDQRQAELARAERVRVPVLHPVD